MEPVECLSGGIVQTRWMRTGMPKINQQVINSVFYLYETESDARSGANAQGTGFVAAVELRNGRQAYYAVTNRHVIENAPGAPVIRLNLTDGGVDIFALDPSDWTYHPGSEDLAATQIDLDDRRHAVSAIPERLFVNQSFVDLSVGEDVFMVGLFVDHEGHETNNPLARFGNIAMLAKDGAPVEGHARFIVDMHSRSGYSGSPVFAYRTFGSDLTAIYGENAAIELDLAGAMELSRRESTAQVNTRIRTQPMFVFLGVHKGQFPENWPIDGGDLTDRNARRGQVVRGVSGMTVVIPAWRIHELLNQTKFADAREEAVLRAGIRGWSIDESVRSTRHREDFNDLLDAAVRGTP